jgi:hypothetical protein
MKSLKKSRETSPQGGERAMLAALRLFARAWYSILPGYEKNRVTVIPLAIERSCLRGRFHDRP